MGNLSKKEDRLYKCLAKSVKIKNIRDKSAINDFVRESFRCRAIAVVSARFGRHGFLPQGPVPTEILPYRVYGYMKNYRDQNLQPYVSKLNDAMLKERFSVGALPASTRRRLYIVFVPLQ